MPKEFIKALLFWGVILVGLFLLSVWEANNKERQCAEAGGEPIYSLVGFYASCVAQKS